MKNLPEKFKERLEQILPKDCYKTVWDSFSLIRPRVFRVNVLKMDLGSVCRILAKDGIPFEPVTWYDQAILMDRSISVDTEPIAGLITNGCIYQQSLSSLWVACVLAPMENEAVLDLCAAPGSKTSQIAAMMNGTGTITAVESVKERLYKLKSVLKLLGVNNVDVQWMDGRKFGKKEVNGLLFDRILVDAPCSSEGRFSVHNLKTHQFWSERKIKEMAHKQKGLLLNAARYLKEDGALVYSTCTFAPEENEGVVDWFLRKTAGAFEIDPVNCPMPVYPALTRWQNKEYHDSVRQCVRILPTETTTGFFAARFKKNL